MKANIRLLVSDTAPLHPPLWGGPKRIWGLFSHLPETFDITYVGVDSGQPGRARTFRPADNITELRFSLPWRYYKAWLPVHKRLFSSLGFDPFTYFFMEQARDYARAVQGAQAGILAASHPWAWNCMRRRPRAPVIYDAHNCEFQLMQSLAGPHPLGAWLAEKTRRLEGDLCRESRAILVCSDQDKEAFVQTYSLNPEKIHVVENGTNIRPLPADKERAKAKQCLGLTGPPAVLFVGAYYKPNIEAVRFILHNLAPALPECRFIIAGTVANAFEGGSGPSNVQFTGRLSEDELALHWQAADIAVNPMFQGSGVNIKMLDYLGSGVPTVSTPFGCRGLDVKNGKHVVLAGPEGFPEAVRSVLDSPALAQSLREQGRAFAASRYDWKALSRKMEEILLPVAP